MLGNRAELTRWAAVWASLASPVDGPDHGDQPDGGPVLHEVSLQAIRDVFRSVVGHRIVDRPPDRQLARFWSDASPARTDESNGPTLAPSIDETIEAVLFAV